MKYVATAEILQEPASFEQLVDDKPRLRIFKPGNDVGTATKEILREVTRLIPDVGVQRSGSLFGVEEIRYTDGSADLHFLTGTPGTEEWQTKNSQTFESLPQDELQTRIDRAIAEYEDSINWNATGI